MKCPVNMFAKFAPSENNHVYSNVTETMDYNTSAGQEEKSEQQGKSEQYAS